MIGRLEKTVLDCPDPRALAGFYAAVLGMEVLEDDPDWVVIGREPACASSPSSARTRGAAAVADPEHPQQLHLDLHVDDVDVAEGRCSGWGRRLPGAPESGFRVFADPADHPFCLVFGRPASSDPRWR